ncbi:MAG TPA: fatty acid desaturase [Candidatus Saccharimonadales bacterium]|nr:fatty acid desaturase [Candidatus Saccharimonadales bacterium]
MRTGQELIKATRKYAVDEPGKSWWYVLSTTTLLIIALAGTLWNFHPAAKIFSSVLAGLLILRLFVIYHDQQHHAILSHSRAAELFMRVFGIYALSPSSVWRSSHNYHHNHNSKLRGSHIGSFPIMTKEQYLKSPRAKRLKYLFMRHPLTILFGYIFMFLQGMCLYPFYNDRKEHFDCLFAFLIHVTIGVVLTYYLGWQALLLTQTIPHFIACAIGTYLFYAQHNFKDVSFRDSAGWTYETAAMESSSYLRTNPVMRWFTANIGYHHIHHLNAKIPFYRLPEVMSEIPELQSPKVTSLTPAEVFRCLRLKVWDAQAQRMVGLSQRETA